MNGRAVGIRVAVPLGLVVAVGGAWLGIRKLTEHPPHDVVITYRRHATTIANDDQLAKETAKTLATKSTHIKRIRSESTRDRVRVECSFDSKPLEYDEDKTAIANTTEQVLHSLDTPEAAPEIEDAAPEARMWVLAKQDLYASLDEIRGVTVWHGCGTPPPKRFRVQLDPSKLVAYKVDVDDFILDVEHAVTEIGGVDAFTLQRLVDFPVKGYVKLSQVASSISYDARIPTCTALDDDGAPVIALRAKLHPKTSAEDRGKFNAVLKDSKATLLEEKDFSEVRFYPREGGAPVQEQLLARDVLTAAKAALPTVAVMMTNEGAGVLLVRREAKDDAIRAFFAKQPATTWGGIAGRRYLQVTTQDRDRNTAQRNAQVIEKKVSAMDGVGQRIITAPPTRAQLTYDIDAERALHEAVELDLLHALLPLDAEEDVTLPVIFAVPLDSVLLRGRPFSTYVSMRTTMATPRLIRINGIPAVEQRWEIVDPKVAKRVRQVVGEAGTVDDVPAVVP